MVPLLEQSDIISVVSQLRALLQVTYPPFFPAVTLLYLRAGVFKLKASSKAVKFDI